MSDVSTLDKAQKVGQGSFASVWAVSSIAFKVCLQPSGKADLEREYRHLQNIYESCNTNGFFAIPRPLAFSDLQAGDIEIAPSSPPNRQVSRANRRRPRIDSSAFTEIKTQGLDTAALAMTWVRRVPIYVSTYIRNHFYPPSARTSAPGVSLCRIYLGKTSSPSSRFFNTSNFILDLQRYTQMSKDLELESPEDVANGMGEILGRLHFDGHIDGRDVELVLGGEPHVESVEYVCFDFNQCRRWDPEHDSVDSLVDAFFANDPYFPRPKKGDELWEVFKKGYSNAVPVRRTAIDFLVALEKRQEEIDSKAS